MPRIFDNIDERLLPALQETLELCHRSDFCVGYFNLRGWRQLHESIESWAGGDGNCCRLLVGMQQMPQEQLRQAMSLVKSGDQIDQATAIALKRRFAQDFRDQLMVMEEAHTFIKRYRDDAENQDASAVCCQVVDWKALADDWQGKTAETDAAEDQGDAEGAEE